MFYDWRLAGSIDETRDLAATAVLPEEPVCPNCGDKGCAHCEPAQTPKRGGRWLNPDEVW